MGIINQPKDDCLIENFDTINLYQVGKTNLSEFSEFVFEMYSYHYLKKYDWLPNTKELEEMKQSDYNHFDDSVYFGFRSSKQKFLGTIKATKRSNKKTFPIEYEFNIDIERIISQKNLKVDEVWHLGRLAIDSIVLRAQNSTLTSMQMVRLLLIHSLRVINHKPNSLMIAESDVLIHQIFQDLGIHMEIVGKVKECLGSPTYPVIFTGENIDKWLKNNPIEQSVLKNVLM
ncbi:hypothetical protein [Aquimarina longa]|uniref:hypothetical protein n=1 Tax=Aquimarina longa TaxID=1080221 RepID=UPI000785C945|nr:hypothetical protein [Aquimarina longa]